MAGAQNQSVGFFDRTPGFSLTLTGANETIRWQPPQVLSSLLFNQGMSAVYPIAEIWRPVAIVYTVTTGITVTNAVVTVRKNGTSAATGGTATLPIQATDATQEYTATLSNYTFAAADAAGDRWSLLVTTTSTAGVVTISIVYGTKLTVGVNTGVSQ